jgi:hypothetical protein
MRAKFIAFVLLIATGSFTIAKDIAPADRPVTTDIGAIADLNRPAFVPKFAVANAAPALQAQRDHALTFSVTPIILIPWGYAPYHCGSFGYRSNHGFYR